MAEKMRRMTVFRGHDVRDFVVFAFGGAGPVHAGAFAKELGVKAVVVPLGDIASVLSALGTISSDVMHVYDANVLLRAPFDPKELDEVFAPLEERARTQLEDEGFGADSVELKRTVFMKFGAQIYDTEVELEGESPEELVAKFEEVYETRFGEGSGYAPAGIELIAQRVYATAAIPRPKVTATSGGATNGSGPTGPSSHRDVWWSEEKDWVSTPIYAGTDGLAHDRATEGPLVIELPDTTIPVRPGQNVSIDEFGNVVITFE